MFRIYRELEEGEYILVGGDCSQGGKDSNFAPFFSTKHFDFPIVYEHQGVAANMTIDIFQALEWVFDRTGVKPVVAFERNNGGASEMERLKAMNINQKYTIFVMPKIGGNSDQNETDKLGWDTNIASRPKLLGEWKNAYDSMQVKIYDAKTLAQHKTFVINKNGKPEAESGFHDDSVISFAICWQLYQLCPLSNQNNTYKTVNRNHELQERWSLG